MAPFDSFPATTPFDSCPLGVSTDSCPAGEFGDFDIKYLKQNISKCRSQISGSFRRNTATLCKNICETLRLKRSLLPSGVKIPDVKHLGGMAAQQNSGCDTSRWNGGDNRILDVIHLGWKVAKPDVMAAAGWNSYPGGMSYDSRPGGMSRIPYSLYSEFAYGFQRTLLNLGLLW
uniref:Uncharacterized protein n=1 Tax=Vitis vinifera TaxID=29760 RepID=A5ANF9_VITVI|nr:hypothetical protein VITISV_026892 [Vitis vinifera]